MTTFVLTNPSLKPVSLHPFGPFMPAGGTISVDDMDLNEMHSKLVDAGILTSSPLMPKGLFQITKDRSIGDIIDIEQYLRKHDTAFAFDSKAGDGRNLGGDNPRTGALNVPQFVDVMIADTLNAQEPFSEVQQVTVALAGVGSLLTTQPVVFETVRVPISTTNPVPADKGILVKRARVQVVSAAGGAMTLSLVDSGASGLTATATLVINWS